MENNITKKEEKYCGTCCWFYAEDTYGYGCCPFQFGELRQCDKLCNITEYISKDEMNHRLEVLQECGRWAKKPKKNPMPDLIEISKAVGFAHRYIKTFSEI